MRYPSSVLQELAHPDREEGSAKQPSGKSRQDLTRLAQQAGKEPERDSLAPVSQLGATALGRGTRKSSGLLPSHLLARELANLLPSEPAVSPAHRCVLGTATGDTCTCKRAAQDRHTP